MLLNLYKNTPSKAEIFRNILKVKSRQLFQYFKVTLFINRVLFFLTLNNRDQLRGPDLFIDQNSERKEKRGGGGEGLEERKGVIKY